MQSTVLSWDVVITVPHAACPPRRHARAVHPCDTAAAPFARALRDALLTHNAFVIVYEGDIARTVVDLNRMESRQTLFRRNVRLAASFMQPAHGLVLDVHSFPPALATEWSAFELVLLDNDAPNWASYTLALAAELTRMGVRVGTQRGSTKNDIQLEMRAAQRHCVLLEISEALSDARKTAIATVVARWVAASYFQNRPAAVSVP